MKIYLIRHGETTWDLEDRYGGDYDDHLSPNGFKQAQKLGRKLKEKEIEVIYHSSKIRATETAQILANKIKAPLIEIENIRERNNYGVLTGMVKKEAEQKFLEEVQKLQKDKWLHQITNSENYDSFKKRVIWALEEIIFSSDLEVIAIVSHGGPIGCFVREYLQLGEFKKMGDCAVIELERSKRRLSLVSIDGAELENYL